MLDGADLAGRQLAAHRQDDRGRRVLLLAAEQGTLGQDEVDAGALDAGERADRAGQLTLEGADIVDVLDEAGGAQRRLLVEDLVADLAAGGQAVLRERHPNRGDLVARHQDGVAVTAHFVGDVLCLQLGDDGGGIFQRQAGIERGERRRGGAHDEEGEKAQHQHGDDGHGGDARQTEAVDKR